MGRIKPSRVRFWNWNIERSDPKPIWYSNLFSAFVSNWASTNSFKSNPFKGDWPTCLGLFSFSHAPFCPSWSWLAPSVSSAAAFSWLWCQRLLQVLISSHRSHQRKSLVDIPCWRFLFASESSLEISPPSSWTTYESLRARFLNIGRLTVDLPNPCCFPAAMISNFLYTSYARPLSLLQSVLSAFVHYKMTTMVLPSLWLTLIALPLAG